MVENQSLTGEIPTEKLPDRVQEAALWFCSNSDKITGNPLLELMARFSLSIRDAVDASKRAHALLYNGEGEGAR